MIVAVPLVRLVPGTFQLSAHPLDPAPGRPAVQQAGLASRDLPKATSLLLLSPGGPGLPPVWVMAGLALAELLPLRAGMGGGA